MDGWCLVWKCNFLSPSCPKTTDMCYNVFFFLLSRQQREVMQAQELLRQLQIPELEDVCQFMHSLPANILMGVGALAALTIYWYATRPKALKPPCDLNMQSVAMTVRECLFKSQIAPLMFQHKSKENSFLSF